MRNLWLSAVMLLAFSGHAQIISIVGTGVNGWPDNMTGAELDMTTTDFITYTLANVAVTTGEVKFRQDHFWTTNWGGSTFPSGNGVQGGTNIPTVAGTYDITFNRSNGTYTFIGSTAFPIVGIWGPAVDGINGFMGPDVNMTTDNGVNITTCRPSISPAERPYSGKTTTRTLFGLARNSQQEPQCLKDRLCLFPAGNIRLTLTGQPANMTFIIRALAYWEPQLPTGTPTLTS